MPETTLEKLRKPGSQNSDNQKSDTQKSDKRLTLRLSDAAYDAVLEIMELGGFNSVQEAIRRAIADERYLLKQRKVHDAEILIKRGKELREIVWPD